MFMWFYLNESNLEDAVLAIRNSRVSDFRHSHIISTAGLTRPELIRVMEPINYSGLYTELHLKMGFRFLFQSILYGTLKTVIT